MSTSKDFSRANSGSVVDDTVAHNISSDLTWIDLLKGIVIIGVFLDNWTGYMNFAKTPQVVYAIVKAFSLAVGPFVQVFFILSGLGLTLAFFRQANTIWDWKKWTWRRFTKIVIPYEFAVLFSFFLGIIGSSIYDSINLRFSISDFLAHLTFTQNFFPESHTWNGPLWYMPVIIGLYIFFPVMLKIFTKFGPWVLLAVSIIITFATLAIAVIVDIYGGHGTDFFTFWVFQFAFGMTLAHIRQTKPEKLRLLIGWLPFFAGLGLMSFSWGLRTYLSMGKIFNDSVTSIGIFLILLNIVWFLRTLVPVTGKVLRTLSGQSYFMYLIHYPIMKFLIGPPLKSISNPIILLILCFVYITIIFYVTKLFSPTLERFTTRLYNKYQVPQKVVEKTTT